MVYYRALKVVWVERCDRGSHVVFNVLTCLCWRGPERSPALFPIILILTQFRLCCMSATSKRIALNRQEYLFVLRGRSILFIWFELYVLCNPCQSSCMHATVNYSINEYEYRVECVAARFDRCYAVLPMRILNWSSLVCYYSRRKLISSRSLLL